MLVNGIKNGMCYSVSVEVFWANHRSLFDVVFLSTRLADIRFEFQAGRERGSDVSCFQLVDLSILAEQFVWVEKHTAVYFCPSQCVFCQISLAEIEFRQALKQMKWCNVGIEKLSLQLNLKSSTQYVNVLFTCSLTRLRQRKFHFVSKSLTIRHFLITLFFFA